MASYPSIRSTSGGTHETGVTTIVVTLPATIEDDDLLFIWVTARSGSGSPTFTTPSGWTATETGIYGTSAVTAVFTKQADGTEDGATVNITVSQTSVAAWVSAAIDDADIANLQVLVSVENTLAGDLNMAAGTPAHGSDDYMFLYSLGMSSALNDIVFDSGVSYPSGYTTVNSVRQGGGSTSVACVAVSYKTATASSEDPGSVGWADDKGIEGAYLISVPYLPVSAETSPASIACVAAVPAPTVKGSASASPASIACLAALLAVTVQAGQATSPASIAALAGVPAVTVEAGQQTSPASIACVGTLPAPSAKGGASVSPASIASVVTLPAVTVQAGQATSPASIACVAALPAPTLQAGQATSPASIAAVATLPAASVGTGQATSPASIACTTALPAVTVQAGQQTSPNPISAVATLPTVTVQAGQQTSPAAIASVASLPAVTVQAGQATSPASIAAVATLPTVTVQAGQATSPSPVACTLTMPVLLAHQVATVTASGDDWMDQCDSFDAAGSLINIGVGDCASYYGVRFTLDAEGAVSVARLRIRSASNNSGAAEFRIRVVDADDSTAPTSHGEVLALTYSATEVTGWVPDAWVAGTWYETPDISTLVQAVLDRPGFLPGQHIQFVIDGTGLRNASTWDADPAYAARLEVTFGLTRASPAPIAVVAALPTTTLQAGQQTSPASIACVGTLPAPTLQAGQQTGPASIPVVVGLPAPTTGAGYRTEPVSIACVAALPAPAATGSSSVSPSTIVCTAAVPAVTTQVSEVVSPAPVRATVTIPAVTLTAGQQTSPATITVVVTMPGAVAGWYIPVTIGWEAEATLVESWEASAALVESWEAEATMVEAWDAEQIMVESWDAEATLVEAWEAETVET